MDEKGLETSLKTNNNFWSYEDELKLLNSINCCGFGNWDDISSRVPPFTAEECEKHYMDIFSCNFDNFIRNDGLCSNNCRIRIGTTKKNNSNYLTITEHNAYLKSLEREENVSSSNRIVPQSNADDSRSNKIYNYMVALPSIGYNRVRSEFDIDYDNTAENILRMIGENHLELAEIDKEESKLLEEMKFIICQSYNSRLKERKIRKQIIRNHCLLDRRKTFTMLQRLDVAFGRTTLKALIPTMRFLKGPQFDFLVERMKYQNELRLKMHLFIEYRSNGLRFINDIDTYKHLQAKRFKYNAELSCFQLPPNSDYRVSIPHYNRKPVTPLALGHLPGYNLLNEDEKKLCSLSRIVPETYNTFKEVLVAECEKHNGLRLAQARNLIKIDVNKTRKIYDYLISINLIWQPQS